MSWVSNLVDTYDRVSGIAGIAGEAGKALLPENHMMMKTDIAVTLDGEGRFRRAELSPAAILIPCTEDSSSRTSGVSAHPLHDNLSYLAKDETKRAKYLKQLEAWSGLHPKVSAVYRYVCGGTVLSDLQGSRIETDPEKSDKLFVRFAVETDLNDPTPNLWEDRNVMAAWRDCCAASQAGNKTVCYVTGKKSHIVSKHPKGVNPSTNGAKLISCNDEANYTYRGRFVKPEQANAISAEASHKSHAMLKYLIATQGNKCDSQAVVAWATDNGSAMPDPFADTYGLVDEGPQTDSEMLAQAQGELGADYAKRFRDAHRGMGNAKALENYNRRAAVMAVDAATTGRMAITFYQDLAQNEYIARLIDWHGSCNYWFRRDGRDIVQAPSANRIIAAVYGEPRGEGYAKIQKQARLRLLRNIVCAEPLERGWAVAAANRVSNPFSYDKQDGGWDKPAWEGALNVVCAMTRKFYNDIVKRDNKTKEAFTLALDIRCEDRDYLFGRLLAVADRLESHARFLQVGKDDTDKRPTNAVRYMTAFAAKPVRTWKVIVGQLNPYIQRLNGAEWYQQTIDDIMELLSGSFDDSPLNGKYLLGYSHQRRALYQKKEDATNESDK